MAERLRKAMHGEPYDRALDRTRRLVNERRFAVRLYGTMIAALAAIIVNAALLPRIGVNGAAYAAIAAQLVAAFLINLFLDPAGFRMQVDAIFFRKTA